jgi:hypothetical protein
MCIKGVTLLSKVSTKLGVKPHLSDTCIGSKWVRWIKVFIARISFRKWSAGLPSLSLELGEGVLFR